MTKYQKCSKFRCSQLVYGEVDFSLPAKRYERVDKNDNLCYVISYPHKDIERPAYCYFHKHFPTYPSPELFRRTEHGEDYMGRNV